MARRRGFFAELQHQSRQSKIRREREQNAQYRAHVAAVRQTEQLQRAAERAQALAAKASAAEQKRLAQEAKEAHVAAMQALAAERNAQLDSQYEELDGILAATLDVDDFVDLEALRKVPEHPPFPRPDLLHPVPKPEPIAAPAEPIYAEPEPTRGIGNLLRRKKHIDVIAEAKADFEKAHTAWQQQMADLPTVRRHQDDAYQAVEQSRLDELAAVERAYEAECQARQAEADEANKSLETFIQNLEYDVEEAVHEYISMVLGNSVYPDFLTVDYDFTFNSVLRELTLTVLVPPPSELPSVKEFKYVATKDEITATPHTAKAQKDRYASVISQIALRTLHEVFEADRAGRIQSITLKVSVENISPATGLTNHTDLLAVATDRTFLDFNLSKVDPSATLRHLNALVSKSPFDLVPIDSSKGVRGRK